MKQQSRKKIFYLFAFAFILISPVLIAYFLGYKFNFEKRVMEKTGGIFIKSAVPRLTIFLNGEFIKETSIISGGALLNDIAPGDYLLRIEKNNYQPWSKMVSITPLMVTELRNTLLVPKPLPVITAASSEISSILSTANSREKLSLTKKGELLRPTPNAEKETIKKSQVVATNVNSFELFNELVFFINNNGFLARLNLETNETKIMGRPGFYLSSVAVKFVKSPKGEVAIIDPSGGLFLLNAAEEIKPMEGGVKNVYFDGKGAKLLIAKSGSIEVLWLADNPNQPFQKRGKRETILQLDSIIKDVRWFYKDNAHIFILTDGGVFLTELDGRGGRNTVELTSAPTDKIFTATDFPEAVFLQRDKAFYRMNIL